MTVKDEYLQFRDSKGLMTNRFNDRVILQKFLKDNGFGKPNLRAYLRHRSIS